MAQKGILILFFIFIPLTVLAGKPERKTIDKLPYKPRWVSVIKKGKVFKYKRREFSSPLVAGKTLFIGSDSRSFYAIDTASGRKIWRFSAQGSISSPPGFFGGTVYFGDDKGILYALDAETGKESWSIELDSEIVTAPAVSDRGIFVATVEGRIVSLSREGKILWEKGHPAPPMKMTIRGNSPPVLDGDRFYVGFWDGTFWCLSAAKGNLLWEKKFESTGFSDLDAPPLIDRDRIYIAPFDGPLLALNRSGKIIWSVPAGSATSIVQEGEILYLSDSKGTLHALSKKDGSSLWSTAIGRGALTAPVLYKDVLAVGLSTKGMNFIDKRTGRLLFRRFARKGISSDPFLDGNLLYYLSNGGRLYSLKMVD